MNHHHLFLSALLLTATVAVKAQRVYHINTDQPRKQVLHFGASDAWSMKYVGLWPEQQQRQIADWLFSTDNDAHGQPRGIGL